MAKNDHSWFPSDTSWRKTTAHGHPLEVSAGLRRNARKREKGPGAVGMKKQRRRWHRMQERLQPDNEIAFGLL